MKGKKSPVKFLPPLLSSHLLPPFFSVLSYFFFLLPLRSRQLETSYTVWVLLLQSWWPMALILARVFLGLHQSQRLIVTKNTSLCSSRGRGKWQYSFIALRFSEVISIRRPGALTTCIW